MPDILQDCPQPTARQTPRDQVAVYPAAVLAKALGVSPQIIRKRMVGPARQAEVNGQERQAWGLDQLPDDWVRKLYARAGERLCRGPHHYLECVAEMMPRPYSFDGFDFASEADLAKARELMAALAPVLHNACELSRRELARRCHERLSALPSLPAMSLSTVRRLVDEVTRLDAGRCEFENIHLWSAIVASRAGARAKNPLPSLSRVAGPKGKIAKMREPEAWAAAFQDFQSLSAEMSPRRAKALVVDGMLRVLSTDSGRDAIRKKADRVFRALEEGVPASFATEDGRRRNAGRERELTFTLEEENRLQSIYLQTNRTSGSGSATMAARIFAEQHEGLADALARRKSKHDLPAAVVQAVRKVKGLVAYHREGDRALRTMAYTPGRLRMAPDGSRRLLAGEQQSWDDGTINFGVCVPWPQGGCPVSDRWKVKLGRFQLLLCHDDATSYVPSWTYVVRPSQSYRGTDTAGAILRAARDCGVPDRIVVEGGVWQSKRVLAVFEEMGVEWIDAKGRPQCKLVENYFNRLWTRLSLESGQVGRFRGEMRRESELYQSCQSGRIDPRKHFPMLDEALHGIENAVKWLNVEPVESREYGTWIPQKRWQEDLAENPRPRLQGDLLWMASPVCEERAVRGGVVRLTADGPSGMRMQWAFSNNKLWDFEKCRVRVYFDPLAEAPVKATIVSAQNIPGGEREGEVICEAESIGRDEGNPFATDAAERIKRGARASMRREYRAVMPDARTGQQRVTRSESEVRGTSGLTEIARGRAGGDDSAIDTNVRRGSTVDLTEQAYQEIDIEELDRLEAEAVAAGLLMLPRDSKIWESLK